MANITKHRFEIYTLRDLVTQLSRELVEVNQIINCINVRLDDLKNLLIEYLTLI